MKSINMSVVQMTVNSDSCQNVLFIGNNHNVVGSLLLDPVEREGVGCRKLLWLVTYLKPGLLENWLFGRHWHFKEKWCVVFVYLLVWVVGAAVTISYIFRNSRDSASKDSDKSYSYMLTNTVLNLRLQNTFALVAVT